ncbi:hypothetical protein LguiB_009475 [Lonicera macranthoides]
MRPSNSSEASIYLNKFSLICVSYGERFVEEIIRKSWVIKWKRRKEHWCELELSFIEIPVSYQLFFFIVTALLKFDKVTDFAVMRSSFIPYVVNNNKVLHD